MNAANAEPRSVSRSHSSRANRCERQVERLGLRRAGRARSRRGRSRGPRQQIARARADERRDAAGQREVSSTSIEPMIDRIDRHRRPRRVRRRLARRPSCRSAAASADRSRPPPASATAAAGPAARRCPSSTSGPAENSGSSRPACRVTNAHACRRRSAACGAIAVGEHRGLRQQAHDEKGLVREVEEDTRDARATCASFEPVAARAPLPTASPAREARPTIRLPAASSVTDGSRRELTRRGSSRFVVESPLRSSARIARPASMSAGAATCTGVDTDRYVSPITSSRSSASPSRARRDRPRAIQPSLTCGRPADFDSPPSANVSARASPTHDTASGRGRSG